MKPILYQSPDQITNNNIGIIYQPYYIYDTVTIYDKSKKTYENRRRLTGISLSSDLTIFIAMTVCSQEDTFSKVKAREVVNRRIMTAIQQIANLRHPTTAYCFDDIHSFNAFCDNMGQFAHFMFTPHNVTGTENKHITTPSGNMKRKRFNVSYPSTPMDVSSIYFHQDFVNKVYLAFKMEMGEATPVTPTL